MRTHAVRTKGTSTHRSTGRIRTLPGIAAIVLAAAFLPACTSSPDSPAGHDAGGSADSEHSGEHGEGTASEEGDLEDNGEVGGEGWSEEIERETQAAGPEYPEDAYLFQRLMTSGSPDLGAFQRAKQQASALQTLAAKTQPSIASRPWSFLGPKNVGGRVVDGVVDPTTDDTIYVAAASNGVWKSSDAGQTFTSVWPAGVTHAMGALAITPDGTLFAGTGETNPGGGSITYGGDGIYRSTNGGQSWQHVGLGNSGTIGRIVVDPNDPDRIWVSVSGNLFTPGGERGVYVSNDGGSTWQQSLAPPNDTTGSTDLAVDPSDSDHLIATMWDHIRKPDARIYTGIGSGIWETHDGGATWQRLGTAQGLQAP
jgi:photosystem II stability/assembly factor-like uncharacterized protein